MIINNLKNVLRMRGVTATELAHRTGINRNTINQIVNNKLTTINIEHLNKICLSLQVNLWDILYFSKWNISFEFEDFTQDDGENMGTFILLFQNEVTLDVVPIYFEFYAMHTKYMPPTDNIYNTFYGYSGNITFKSIYDFLRYHRRMLLGKNLKNYVENAMNKALVEYCREKYDADCQIFLDEAITMHDVSSESLNVLEIIHKEIHR